MLCLDLFFISQLFLLIYYSPNIHVKFCNQFVNSSCLGYTSVFPLRKSILIPSVTCALPAILPYSPTEGFSELPPNARTLAKYCSSLSWFACEVRMKGAPLSRRNLTYSTVDLTVMRKF